MKGQLKINLLQLSEGIGLRASESVDISLKSLRDIRRRIAEIRLDSKKTKNLHMLSRLLLDARKSLLEKE